MVLPLYAILDVGLFLSEAALVRLRPAARPAPTAAATGSGGNLDRGSIRVLWVVITLALTAGHFVALSGLGPGLGLGPDARGWLGVGVFLAGCGLRAWAVRHLGRFFTVSVALAADHRVVNDGPYRLVRHPSYTGLLMEFAGVGIVLGSWAGLAVILVPIFLALVRRMHVEEAALRGGLGEAYVEYVRRTRRLVPGVY